MMTVTTQASPSDKRPTSRQATQEYIKSLTFNLAGHAGGHALAEVFDPRCAECIYWAAKIVQHPELWQGTYHAQQKGCLRTVPLEVINFVITKLNADGYPLKVKAHEFDMQEYLQDVMA